MAHYSTHEWHYYQYIDEDQTRVRLFYLGTLTREGPCTCIEYTGDHVCSEYSLVDQRVVWKRLEIAISRWCPCAHKCLISRTHKEWNELKERAAGKDKSI